jgi:hypothetical protein
VNLLSLSQIKNLNPFALAKIHEQVAGLLNGPGSRQVRGDAQDVHGAGLDLHHNQHVQASQQHGIDMQEVTREDA